MSPRLVNLLLTTCGAVLAGCDAPPEQAAPVAEADPIIEQALNDPIMVDPDLASRNEASAALSGSVDHSLPPEIATRAAIEAAREDAAQLLGGSPDPAPAARSSQRRIPPDFPLSASARARHAGARSSCADRLSYSTAWAARLPTTLPVYPRGATQEAAGTDASGCALRVVNYLTPVPLEDVLAFYATSSRNAGYSLDHVIEGGDNVLTGRRPGAFYAVHARESDSGLREVDLVTGR